MGDSDPRIGCVIDGRYRIEATIGRGGFGAVYRGSHLALDRPVALKRIRGGDGDDLVARFRREAQLQARLRHPVCVIVHDFVTDADGAPWLVQELVRGETLEGVLRAEGALDPARVVAIACRLLDGLAAAHAIGIVHRDIKPANIMLVRSGDREDVRLLDFGIARAMSRDETCMTSPGVIVGTPRYISPEQARGEPPEPANDLYAVGVVIYHMLTGEPPFRARAMKDAVVAHLTLDPPPLPPEIPPHLAAVVEAALAKAPSARPPHAEAMIDRLRAARVARVAQPPAEPTMTSHGITPRPAPRISRRAAVATITSLGVAAAAASWWVTDAPRVGPDPPTFTAAALSIGPAPSDLTPTVTADPTPSGPTPIATAPDAGPTPPRERHASLSTDPPKGPRPTHADPRPRSPADVRSTRIARTRADFTNALTACDCPRANDLLTRLDAVDRRAEDHRAMLVRCRLKTSRSCASAAEPNE